MTAAVPRTLLLRSHSAQLFSRKHLLLASTALMVTLAQGAMADEIIDEVRTITTDTTYTGKIFIGHTTTGDLTIRDGGAVRNTEENTIGYDTGVSGRVTVTGAGSTWTNVQDSVVGWFGAAELHVENGGAVYDQNGTVGYAATGTGSVTVTGAGSKWINSNQLVIGWSGQADMTISDGAFVSNGTNGFLGARDGGVGTAVVTGPGSTWTNSEQLVLGLGESTGTLLIENGGTVINANGRIGLSANSTGIVTVTGTNSTLTDNGTILRVAYDGEGTLTIADGGLVTVGALTNGVYDGTLNIATNTGSTGTLNIGAAEGSPSQAAGRLQAASITFGNGHGTVVFNHNDTGYDFASNISGHGTIKVLHGETTLSGNNSAFTGLTTVSSGGALNVTGSLGGGATAVTLDGGELTNSGVIKGGTTSVFFATGGNTLNILPTAVFDGVVDYNNKIGNTTTFGAGSYSIDAANYNDASNTIRLNNSRQMVVLKDADTTGTINVVAVPAASQTAKQYTASVSDVVGSILALDVARPDQVVIGGSTISALQYGEQKGETSESKALRTLGDGIAVDGYGNLFWARAFGGLRYQPSGDGDPSSHTSHYGLISGVDHQFENYRLGFFGGAGSVRSVADDSSSKTTGVTGFLGLYGAMKTNGLQWNASITGGAIDNEATRWVNNGASKASGDFMGWYVSPEMSVSTTYEIAPEWELTPSIKARYTGAFYDGYSESGPSSQNLSYDSRQSHSIDGRLQIELKRKITLSSGVPATISASASVLDTQYLGSDATHVRLENNEFSVSNSADRNVVGASIGVGFDAMVSERTSVYGGIDGTIYSDDSVSGSGRLGLKLAF